MGEPRTMQQEESVARPSSDAHGKRTIAREEGEEAEGKEDVVPELVGEGPERESSSRRRGRGWTGGRGRCRERPWLVRVLTDVVGDVVGDLRPV